jgi:hemoglobin
MTPTIYEWAGGREAFTRWLNRFYDLVELEAPAIAAMFGGNLSETHRTHVTDWWSEVMGGPAVYTEEQGGYESMPPPPPPRPRVGSTCNSTRLRRRVAHRHR